MVLQRNFLMRQNLQSDLSIFHLNTVRTTIMPLNEEGFITRVSRRHSVSPDAVRTILLALRSGGGDVQ
jgi:hypothetical protein